jgi:hypothetical protein
VSIDELIDNALNSGGGSLDPTNLFALVGDPASGEVLVLSLSDFLLDNFRFFVQQEQGGLILLGVYNCESAARSSSASLVEDKILGDTGLVGAAGWYVLLGDSTKNNLFSLSLLDYYSGYNAMFKYKAVGGRGIVVLNIFSTQQAADEFADFIRMYIIDKEGRLL